MYKKFLKRKVGKYTAEELKKLSAIADALSAQAKLPSQKAADDQSDAVLIRKGIAYLEDDIGCIDCHAFGEPDPDADGPDLTGYGSREWMLGIVHDPAHERFYGKKNDRMPAFGADGQLTHRQMELIVDWIRSE